MAVGEYFQTVRTFRRFQSQECRGQITNDLRHTELPLGPAKPSVARCEGPFPADYRVPSGLTVSECRSCCWHSRYRNEVCSLRRVCRVVRNTVPPTFSRTHFPLFPPVGLMTEPLQTLCDAVPPGSGAPAVADVALSPASLSLLLLLLLLLLPLRWRQLWCVDNSTASVGSSCSCAVVAIWTKDARDELQSSEPVRMLPRLFRLSPPRYWRSRGCQIRPS